MPGKADYWSDSRPARLQAAAVTLAQFHRAVESFPSPGGRTPDELPTPRLGLSASIAERLALVGRLRRNGFSDLWASVWENRSVMPALADRAEALLELVYPQLEDLQHELAAASRIETPQQPCLRDIWHDHVLFEGNRVSGIIDIGSMRLDNVAIDIARLLGSLCGNDRDGWATGLDAYRACRPLAETELALLRTFDRSQVMLAGVKWVEWVFVELRTFDDPPAVVERMERILSRLRGACLVR
jgi:homoserine kinase type II